jgi:hypothetical protein
MVYRPIGHICRARADPSELCGWNEVVLVLVSPIAFQDIATLEWPANRACT